MARTGRKKLFDDLLLHLKTGKWNCLTLLLASLWTLQVPFYVFSGAFSTPGVPHTCVNATRGPPPPLHTSRPYPDTSSYIPDASSPFPDTTSLPPDFEAITNAFSDYEDGFPIVQNASFLKDGNESLECALPGGLPNTCTSWDFDTSTYGKTMTLEFELVCQNKIYRSLYSSLYFFGAALGSIISGWMSDRFGRRKVFVVGTSVFAVLANVLPWMHNLSVIIALRFIIGFLHPTTVQASFSLVMEVFEERRRAMAGIIVFLPWPLGMALMAGVCSLLKDWRWQSFYLSLPSLLSLPLFWTMDESPRWLIVRGYHEEAHRTLKKAARWNKTSLPPDADLLAMMEDIRHQAADNSRRPPNSAGRRYRLMRLCDSFAILFRSRRMRRITLTSYLVFLLTSLSYFGLSLSGDLFSSEPFLYMAISGVVEIPGCTLTIPLVERFGRRLSNVVLYFVTGCSIICLTFIPSQFESAVMSLALLGKMNISAAFQVILLHTSELFPTEVRALGMGSATMVSRIGSTLASFLVDALPSSWKTAPSIIIGCSSFVAAGATLLLPETRGAPLHDTVAALESASHKRDQDDERIEELITEDVKPVLIPANTTTTTTTATIDTSTATTVITTTHSSSSSSSSSVFSPPPSYSSSANFIRTTKEKILRKEVV